MEKEKLRVDEPYSKDELRGIARIDDKSMQELGLADGDIIEILGKSEAVATCKPLFEQDQGRKVIRIDRMTQQNAGLQAGDTASVKKTTASFAKEITLDPIEKIPPMDSRYITDSLNGVVLAKGNQCVIPYFGGAVGFLVVRTIPSGNVIVKKDYTSCITTRDSSSDPSVNMQIHSIIQDILKLDTLSKDELDAVIKKLKSIYDIVHSEAFRYPKK
ncbi:MAG: hypothetical protein K5798_09955 [Nitrosopumilus sp.]|uniref:hypothetical protein n=1 Tax=Nitrosopumilus sp. TaxID=2024843 RepID=UPI0024332804|nr:hypothetical protein [Nitrosopumilus sp.]MCV0367567.1 hypothetical protein [Nitrosopumilus sp.]